MSTSLNVIALISGGKDSLYSLSHCNLHNHRIVALANLYPPPDPENPDADPNSYMYQTAGHTVIPCYATALGLPLYRAPITGRAVNSAREYAPPAAEQEGEEHEADETEDLVPLLRRIKAQHPEANALSSGAILSTYQRTRVESIALRLGLTPLAFLWQYPVLPPYLQSSLLDDMFRAGLEAVLVKTASGGLDERVLGLNVADPRTVGRVQGALARFGEGGDGAVLGEGGEFETLAVNGPKPVWKGRVQIQGEKGMCEGQGVLRITGCEVVGFEEGGEEEQEKGEVRVPDLFDDEFKSLLARLDTATTTTLPHPKDTTAPLPSALLPTNTTTATPSTLTISNLTSPGPTTPSAQLTSILSTLSTTLSAHSLTPHHITHTTLLLRDMSSFASLNEIYSPFFPLPNPPSRVCIAAGAEMPQGVDVMLSAVAYRGPLEHRSALHVQSRSYWAPANIGPYSQGVVVPLEERGSGAGGTASPSNAVADDASDDDDRYTQQDPGVNTQRIVTIAGQIPLVPHTMEPLSSSTTTTSTSNDTFTTAAALSLQHAHRVARELRVEALGPGMAFITAPLSSSTSSTTSSLEADAEVRAKKAMTVWTALSSPTSTSEEDAQDNSEDDQDPWDALNARTHPVFNNATPRAPLSTPANVYAAQVSALPRGVGVEWSVVGLTCPPASSGSAGSGEGKERLVARAIPHHADAARVLGETKGWGRRVVYAGRGIGVGEGDCVSGAEKGSEEWVGAWVPCLRVWGVEEGEVAGVVFGVLP